ncbi:hypothetical protein T484DRAFT_1928482 [Baffinella frigidus]|nr:hypothetical protein T484DRAFT_1928482 [Cryptophyta sp. CCMP2293]|mmetsp:Transcript_57185/g.135823  ORF Transcript_57185/g.135823 Transcript_57185/m.135823 type:complete len:211 (+) Transcript_57185:127-759(+)
MVLVSVRHAESGLATHARKCPARAPDEMGQRSHVGFRHNGDDAQLVSQQNVSQADTLHPDAFLADEMSDPLLFLIDFDDESISTDNFLNEVDQCELGQGFVLDEASATAMSELNDAPSEAPSPFLIIPESFSPSCVTVAHENAAISCATTPFSTAAAATKCPLRSSDDLAPSAGTGAVNRSSGRRLVAPELEEPLAKRRRGNGRTNTVGA